MLPIFPHHHNALKPMSALPTQEGQEAIDPGHHHQTYLRYAAQPHSPDYPSSEYSLEKNVNAKRKNGAREVLYHRLDLRH
jgi:hypothetical protein